MSQVISWVINKIYWKLIWFTHLIRMNNLLFVLFTSLSSFTWTIVLRTCFKSLFLWNFSEIILGLFSSAVATVANHWHYHFLVCDIFWKYTLERIAQIEKFFLAWDFALQNLWLNICFACLINTQCTFYVLESRVPLTSWTWCQQISWNTSVATALNPHLRSLVH